MTEQVTYTAIAKTRDSGDPVMRVKLHDSYMDVILDTEDKCVNVWTVDSVNEGDMSTMLDDLIGQLSTNTVQFIAPLEDKTKQAANEAFDKVGLPENVKFGFDGPDKDVEDVVNGFEKVIKHHNGQEIPLLKGEWEI